MRTLARRSGAWKGRSQSMSAGESGCPLE